MRVSALRYPLFALVLIMMSAGGWAALQRAGWVLPTIRPSLIGIHGALMIGGVFGALIALERAVAISSLLRQPRHWSFLAPLLAGIGGILLILDGASIAARASITAASLVLIWVYGYTATKHHYWSLHTAIMCVGAGLWAVGNVVWLTGSPVYSVVHVWMAFIVLTIVGERLELSRVTRLTKRTEQLLMGAVTVYTTGTVLAIFALAEGVRVAGIGAILTALWLMRYDLASKRLKHAGLTRYIALCLFSGYIWLGISGVFSLIFGAVYAGFQYDAVIHAVVGGFIFSMVLGHAPMIFPALTGRQIAYSSAFYLPLALLHASILMREISNVIASFQGRMWAGMINAVAILLFMGMMIYGMRLYARQQSALVQAESGVTG